MKIWPAPEPDAKPQKTRPAGELNFLQTAGHVLLHSASEFMEDNIMNVAAAATFYILLGFFPAVAAFVSLYGLFAKIETVRAHLSYLVGFLPNSVLQFVGDEMVRITQTHPSRLSGAFFLSLAFSIWSANAGVMALIAGLNVAYEERETRGIIVGRLISLAITLGSLLVLVGAVFLFLALPVMQISAGITSLHLLRVFRWPVIYTGTVLVLSAMYAYGTSGKKRGRRRVLPGALLASTAWLGCSFLFSWYVTNYANYDRTYGSLAAVVGFLIWIWLGLMVILFGAELNCELERLHAPKPPLPPGAKTTL
jgi:membrane protein